MISLIGIIIGLALFIIMAFKGHNLAIAAFLGTGLMIVFSGKGLIEGFDELFLPAIGSAFNTYVLIFVFGALLGQLLIDTGEARKLALSCTKLIYKFKSDRSRSWACLMVIGILYAILSYIGVSGYILLFTVMPIAKDIFKETDTPWKLYCYGGTQSTSVFILAGAVNVANVYSASLCGTTTSSGIFISLVGFLGYVITSAVMAWFYVGKIKKSGEKFLPSGEGILKAQMAAPMEDDKLPGLVASIAPVLTLIVLIVGFDVNMNIGLIVGCLVSVAFGWKNVKDKLKTSVMAGVSSCYGPLICVSAASALGATIKQLPGFTIIEDALSLLPSTGEAFGLLIIFTFVMANPASAIMAFGSKITEKFFEAGFSAVEVHRLLCSCGFACYGPHNAGCANASMVLRIKYSECLKIYMLFSWIPGIVGMLLTLLVASL